ncbi:MAG: M20/M25/M40 family metallo-hydrolase [Thermoplasmata archaeon]|nr:M20/M25/M40 family metallo-hydrolase [Thermoplasmata archaeon]
MSKAPDLPTPSDPTPEAIEAIGGAECLSFLSELVATAPTNLEDPLHDRFEKPNYGAAADVITRAAESWGFTVTRYDPSTEEDTTKYRGIPRPNLRIDLDRGAPSTILLLAHYDVVPVPAEQLDRWLTPPHVLTFRTDGRFYGRGSNDDLGSGVLASLLAMRALAKTHAKRRNVRLIVCPDEETGGFGGIEALKARDARLRANDPHRWIVGDSVLIPDGSPHIAAASSGVLMLDAGFETPVDTEHVLQLGHILVNLNEIAKTWKSTYPSPEWPDEGAPEAVITGRATVTRFDVEGDGVNTIRPRLLRAHAETDATNQIPRSVTLVFQGMGEQLLPLSRWLSMQLSAPFHLEATRPGATNVEIPPGALAVSVVGVGGHGGYPHRAHNPVPAALRLIEEAIINAKIDDVPTVLASFGVDVRLPPETPLAKGVSLALDPLRAAISGGALTAHLEAPAARQRSGYALALDDEVLLRFQRVAKETLGGSQVFGEYGGTDASSLLGIRTPAGHPMPALVFGSMDRRANIHDAEESVDPLLITDVAETIRRFVADV